MLIDLFAARWKIGFIIIIIVIIVFFSSTLASAAEHVKCRGVDVRDLRREEWELVPAREGRRERRPCAFYSALGRKIKTKLDSLVLQTAPRVLAWLRWLHSLIRCDL